MSVFPARSVIPYGPKSHALPARLLYAVVASVCAWFAIASAWIVPLTIPGGKPVIELPPYGQMPRSPLRMVIPVFDTAEAPRTAKGPALPSEGAVRAASGRADTLRAATLIDRPASERETTRMIEISRYFSLRKVFCVLPKLSNQAGVICQWGIWRKRNPDQ